MKLHKTTDIIDAMIGPIHPTGDHGEDRQRFQNLEDLIEIMREYVSRLENIAEVHKNSSQKSMKIIGQRAYEYRSKLTHFDL